MTLSECTKADLLWIIKRMQQRYLYDGDYALQRALSDLGLEKIRKCHDEAEQCSRLADEKRREYIEILKGYEGMRLIDIPLPVLEKLDQLSKETLKYDKRWNRLMGLDL